MTNYIFQECPSELVRTSTLKRKITWQTHDLFAPPAAAGQTTELPGLEEMCAAVRDPLVWNQAPVLAFYTAAGYDSFVPLKTHTVSTGITWYSEGNRTPGSADHGDDVDRPREITKNMWKTTAGNSCNTSKTGTVSVSTATSRLTETQLISSLMRCRAGCRQPPIEQDQPVNFHKAVRQPVIEPAAALQWPRAASEGQRTLWLSSHLHKRGAISVSAKPAWPEKTPPNRLGQVTTGCEVTTYELTPHVLRVRPLDPATGAPVYTGVRPPGVNPEQAIMPADTAADRADPPTGATVHTGSGVKPQSLTKQETRALDQAADLGLMANFLQLGDHHVKLDSYVWASLHAALAKATRLRGTATTESPDSPTIRPLKLSTCRHVGDLLNIPRISAALRAIRTVWKSGSAGGSFTHRTTTWTYNMCLRWLECWQPSDGNFWTCLEKSWGSSGRRIFTTTGTVSAGRCQFDSMHPSGHLCCSLHESGLTSATTSSMISSFTPTRVNSRSVTMTGVRGRATCKHAGCSTPRARQIRVRQTESKMDWNTPGGYRATRRTRSASPGHRWEHQISAPRRCVVSARSCLPAGVDLRTETRSGVRCPSPACSHKVRITNTLISRLTHITSHSEMQRYATLDSELPHSLLVVIPAQWDQWRATQLADGLLVIETEVRDLTLLLVHPHATPAVLAVLFTVGGIPLVHRWTQVELCPWDALTWAATTGWQRSSGRTSPSSATSSSQPALRLMRETWVYQYHRHTFCRQESRPPPIMTARHLLQGVSQLAQIRLLMLVERNADAVPRPDLKQPLAISLAQEWAVLRRQHLEQQPPFHRNPPTDDLWCVQYISSGSIHSSRADPTGQQGNRPEQQTSSHGSRRTTLDDTKPILISSPCPLRINRMLTGTDHQSGDPQWTVKSEAATSVLTRLLQHQTNQGRAAMAVDQQIEFLNGIPIRQRTFTYQIRLRGLQRLRTLYRNVANLTQHQIKLIRTYTLALSRVTPVSEPDLPQLLPPGDLLPSSISEIPENQLQEIQKEDRDLIVELLKAVKQATNGQSAPHEPALKPTAGS